MQLYFVDVWWTLTLLAIGSYFIGNINFAIIISRLKHTKEITINIILHLKKDSILIWILRI